MKAMAITCDDSVTVTAQTEEDTTDEAPLTKKCHGFFSMLTDMPKILPVPPQSQR